MTAEPWSVEFEPRADKDIGRLDAQVKQRVFTAIDRLATDPHGATLLRLTGLAQSRLRVGDWRVIVELDIAKPQSWSCVSFFPVAAHTTTDRGPAGEVPSQ